MRRATKTTLKNSAKYRIDWRRQYQPGKSNANLKIRAPMQWWCSNHWMWTEILPEEVEIVAYLSAAERQIVSTGGLSSLSNFSTSPTRTRDRSSRKTTNRTFVKACQEINNNFISWQQQPRRISLFRSGIVRKVPVHNHRTASQSRLIKSFIAVTLSKKASQLQTNKTYWNQNSIWKI